MVVGSEGKRDPVTQLVDPSSSFYLSNVEVGKGGRNLRLS